MYSIATNIEELLSFSPKLAVQEAPSVWSRGQPSETLWTHRAHRKPLVQKQRHKKMIKSIQRLRTSSEWHKIRNLPAAQRLRTLFSPCSREIPLAAEAVLRHSSLRWKNQLEAIQLTCGRLAPSRQHIARVTEPCITPPHKGSPVRRCMHQFSLCVLHARQIGYGEIKRRTSLKR